MTVTALAGTARISGLEEALGTRALPARVTYQPSRQPLSPASLEVRCASVSSELWSAPSSLRAPLRVPPTPIPAPSKAAEVFRIQCSRQIWVEFLPLFWVLRMKHEQNLI